MTKQMLIDGAWVDALSGGRWDVVNPSTEEIVESVPFGGAEDTNRAIEAAHRALPAWRARTPYDRGAILEKTAAIIRAKAEQLAAITTSEAGKPKPEAVGEWMVAADLFDHFAEEGKRAYGYTLPSRRANKRLMVLREPVGVVGVITAWNFPAYNPARSIAAALAAGCTVVVRPAELTPLSAMAIAQALVDAGLPAGALNLVNGEPAAMGKAMLDHPECRKISFTGSVPVGKLLMDGASKTLTRLSLELGGNAPVLVLPDADIEVVAKGAVAARFRNAGQVCVSPQRFFVARDKMKTFEEIVVEETRKVTVGPLISPRHRDRVEGLVASAVSSGATVRTGGTRPARKGYFYDPTVLGNVDTAAAAFSDEVFGPVFAMTSFDQLDAAIAAANSTRYGLAAYVFTNDLNTAMRAYERLEFGMIGVNDWSPQATEAPFAGRKESGIGHECGREGLADNLETKLVSFGNVS